MTMTERLLEATKEIQMVTMKTVQKALRTSDRDKFNII